MIPWSSLEIDELMDWPINAQLLMSLVLMIFLQFFLSWWWLFPLQEELIIRRAEDKQLTATLQSKRLKLTSLQIELSPIKEMSAHYNSMMNQMPEQSDLSELLSQINRLGMIHRLDFVRFGWGAKENKGYLSNIPIHIELHGSFHDIGRFSEAVAALPTIVNVQEIELSKNADREKSITVKMIALTYQANQDSVLDTNVLFQMTAEQLSNQKESINISPVTLYVGSSQRSVFYTEKMNTRKVNSSPKCTQVSPKRAKTVITERALNQLILRGVMLVDNQYIGLLQASDRETIRVYEGQSIGPNYGEIVEIDDRGIVIKELSVNANGCWTGSLFSILLTK